MTIEIRQLVIKAVVEAPPSSQRKTTGRVSLDPAQESALVARCTRSVLQALEQLQER